MYSKASERVTAASSLAIEKVTQKDLDSKQPVRHSHAVSDDGMSFFSCPK